MFILTVGGHISYMLNYVHFFHGDQNIKKNILKKAPGTLLTVACETFPWRLMPSAWELRITRLDTWISEDPGNVSRWTVVRKWSESWGKLNCTAWILGSWTFFNNWISAFLVFFVPTLSNMGFRVLEISGVQTSTLELRKGELGGDPDWSWSGSRHNVWQNSGLRISIGYYWIPLDMSWILLGCLIHWNHQHCTLGYSCKNWTTLMSRTQTAPSLRSAGIRNPYSKLCGSHTIGFAEAALFHPMICLTIIISRDWRTYLKGAQIVSRGGNQNWKADVHGCSPLMLMESHKT